MVAEKILEHSYKSAACSLMLGEYDTGCKELE